MRRRDSLRRSTSYFSLLWGTQVPSCSEPACVCTSPVSLPSTDVHAPQSERGSAFAHGDSKGTGARAQTWNRLGRSERLSVCGLRKELPSGLGSRNRRDVFSKLMGAKPSHVTGGGRGGRVVLPCRRDSRGYKRGSVVRVSWTVSTPEAQYFLLLCSGPWVGLGYAPGETSP